MRMKCSGLIPSCDVELRGESVNDVVAQYVEHAMTCMQRAVPIQIEELLGAVTLL